MGISANGQTALGRELGDGRSYARRYAVTTLLAAMLLGLVGVAPATAQAATLSAGTLVVDRTDDDPTRSACTDEPSDCSLRGALINAAADADAEIETIELPAGIFELAPGDSYTTGSLNVTSSVAIRGAGPALTIIDANGVDRVLVVNGSGTDSFGALDLSGVTLTGGRPCNQLGGGDDGGNIAGGALMLAGPATLTDVVVTDSETCGAGGGIWVSVFGGSLTATRTVVTGNRSLHSGGGIRSDGPLTLIDSTVRGNESTSDRGGGIATAGTASISGSTISGNVAVRYAGGMSADGNAVSISNSTVSGNRAKYYNSGTPQYFPGTAGGLFFTNATVDLRHVTVTGNVADWNYFHQANGVGAGISLSFTALTLDNSIVAGNTGEADCNLYGTSSVSATGSFGCSTVVVEDPVLGPLADNGGVTLTHAVLEGSPALDSADPTLCLPTDQRGVVRPAGAGCDAGAYELAPLDVTPPETTIESGPAAETTATSATLTFSADEAGTFECSLDGASFTPCASPTTFANLSQGEHDFLVRATDDLGNTDGTPATWSWTILAPPNVDLVVSDCAAPGLADIVNVAGDITVTDTDCAELSLPNLTSVGGSIIVADDATLERLSLPLLERVEGDVIIAGNGALTDVDLGSLSFVGGDLVVSTSPSLTELSFPAATVSGGVNVSQNQTLTVIDFSELETVGGDLDVGQNQVLTTMDFSELESVGGDLDVSGNATLTDVSAPTLTTIGGDLNVGDNTTLTSVSAPAVTAVGGDIDVTGNSDLTTLEFPELETVGNDIEVSQNTTFADGTPLVLRLPSLLAVGGSLLITGNVELTTVEASALIDVSGDATFTDNPNLTSLSVPELETVGGDLTLELEQATIDVSDVSVGGDSSIIGIGTELLLAETAVGTTSVSLRTGATTFDAILPDGSLSTAVPFTIERLEGPDLDPQAGADPLAAYQLDIDDATLNVNAALAFSLDLDQLPSSEAQAILDASGAGLITIAVRADGAAIYEPFVVCAAGQSPAADGCVTVVREGSIVSLQGSASHFSAWAAVIVPAADMTPPVVTVPADITAAATSPAGAIVTFAASAFDLVDGAIAPTCTPASGASFALGDTTVTCEATDIAGNPGTASFVIHVLGAVDQLTALRDDVAAAAPPLSKKLANDLRTKLTDALGKLALGKTADGCKKIQDFVDKVAHESGKESISTTMAADWLRRARQIQAVLGC